MASSSSRMLFVRPNNMMLTHPLQLLGIALRLAKWSDDKLTRFRVPREPDQQRLLNFASFTFENPDAAQDVIRKSSTNQVSLNSRAAMNYERLAFAEKLENRDIGLVEIASIVGLPLDVAGKRVIRNKMNDTESESQSFNQNDADSEMDYILAPVSEPIKEAAFQAIIKCERRQTLSENLRMGTRAPHSKKRPDGGLIDERQSGENRFISPLQQKWELFGGFSKRNKGKQRREEDSASIECRR